MYNQTNTYNQAVNKKQVLSESFRSQEIYGNNFFDSLFSFLRFLFDWIFFIFVLFIILFFIYTIIKFIIVYKSKGGDEALKFSKELNSEIFLLFLKVFSGIGFFLKIIFSFLFKKKWIFISLIIILFSFSFILKNNLIGVLKVKPGQKAVSINEEKILGPGTYIISPKFSDYIISHTANYDFDISQITADSKEIQDVILDLNVSFHFDEKNLINFYKTNGTISIWDVSNSIITPRVVEEIKEVIKNYSFRDVYIKKSEIKKNSLEKIRQILDPMGIKLDDINIINIRISQKFVDYIGDTESIFDKTTIKQKELELEKMETEKSLEISKREKQKKILEAEGISKYNEILQTQKITPELIQIKKLELEEKAIQKWNGNAPQNVGGDFIFGK